MSKEDLLKNSDIISIHLVLGERYKNLISKKELGMMKKTAIIIKLIILKLNGWKDKTVKEPMKQGKRYKTKNLLFWYLSII